METNQQIMWNNIYEEESTYKMIELVDPEWIKVCRWFLYKQFRIMKQEETAVGAVLLLRQLPQ